MRASIDIGSNTVLLLVARVEGERVIPICEEQKAPRLGRGMDAEQNLQPESIAGVVAALKDYRALLEEKYLDVQSVDVVATSAVRDAANRASFLQKVKDETAFDVKVLSGEKEADLTYQGALSVLPPITDHSGVIDIGGGSTEIAVGKEGKMTDRYSFDIGSVRFTERYLKDSPPTLEQLKECKSAVAKALAAHPFNWRQEGKLIGVAGTVTSLAMILHDMSSYNPQKLNGLTVQRPEISSIVSQIKAKTAEQLLSEYPTVLKGRADIILSGLIILEEFMKQYQVPSLTVSTGGIRHGAVLQH